MTKFWMVVVAILVLLAMTAGMTGCPDDDTCNDCSCDPSLCDPDSDTDSDADADSDVPAQYGSLTVTSTPVSGAAIELDHTPSGEVTDYTFSSIEARTHSVLLSMTGRLAVPDGCTELPCPPASVDVTTTGTDVNIFLGWDLGGSWRWEGTTDNYDFTMVVQPPDDRCPDTWLRVIGVQPAGTLCLEADDTLSLCKTRACGDEWAEGTILNNGQRVELTHHISLGDLSVAYTRQ